MESPVQALKSGRPRPIEEGPPGIRTPLVARVRGAPMSVLPSSYDPWVVAVSVLMASFASYVALDLAKRVRTKDRGVGRAWWAGGSIAMGTGIWCMHFVGMLAFSLPIALAYERRMTMLSWLAGVAVSAVALSVASRGRLSWSRLVGGALVMGVGICAMHYTGMMALQMQPGITWDLRLVAASAVIAALASAAALQIFFWLREHDGWQGFVLQAAAAVVMGLAIAGMHYTGMAAASFPEGSICLSAGALGGGKLGAMVSLFSMALLVMTLLASLLDARMQGSLNAANRKLQRANEELRRRAFVDPLTGLPNRLLFEERLEHALARVDSGRGRRIAVLFVDLDGFKPVNDSFGHAVGDVVLKEVATRLRGAAREGDTLARIGGDEFVLLMERVATPADCARLAEDVLQSVRKPFDVAGRPVAISASIGIVIHPDQGQRDKLIANADAAMYAAKRARGNGYALFESHMDADAREQIALQSDLRRAIELRQLELYYQPKVDGLSGHIHGVEALLRWNHPVRGIISPGVFIPIAERFGLINGLGAWVIDESCRQMHAWADAGLRVRVAINISVHQLRERDLAQRIDGALRRHGVEPSQLLCEITESVAMEDFAGAQRAFESLAGIGVFLSIDDFGTGYSSLAYLSQLPARQLKIDRSFVNGLGRDHNARAIVSAVIRLAHELGLRVVAEGVETESQRGILIDLGCDELQGFLFARPMPATALEAWAEGRNPEAQVDFAPSVIMADELLD
jgi:diguanylate cyclase (GGDEF)-like protein